MDLFSQQRRLFLLHMAAVSALAGCGHYGVRAPVQQGVRRLQGSAWLDGRPLQQGDIVPSEGELVTDAESHLVFVRDANAYLLRADSKLRFERNAAGHSDLHLQHGGVLSVFAPGAVTIKTPIAQIGIRGTGCYVESHPKKSYICLCYGVGDIHSSITGELLMEVKTRHHDSPFNIYPDGELMAPMPVINHTDDELILLESLVGRTPPFSEEEY